MTKIKICGITRFEDVDYVNKLLPDYIGFVFAPSKRQVHINQAKKLIASLDKNIKTVGVFVNEDCEKVKYIAKTLKLDVLQFHANEDNIYIENFKGLNIWKTISISVADENNIMEDQKEINTINNYPINAILMDSYIKGISGGSGKGFDWSIIKNLVIGKPIVLAGGLNPENITQAVKLVNPYCVDVSSGIETNGIKDFEKIKKFINKVRLLK